MKGLILKHERFRDVGFKVVDYIENKTNFEIFGHWVNLDENYVCFNHQFIKIEKKDLNNWVATDALPCPIWRKVG